MSDLASKHCTSCEGIGAALTETQLTKLLPQLSEKWEVISNNLKIKRSFKFKNFFETMSFVNAVAFISNVENHHPDMEIGYNYCNITFTTHALNGLTQNDFICAAKIDELLKQ